MTPLYYSGSPVHIRHLNNSPERDGRWQVSRELCRYELIPEKQFATIALNSPGPEGAGTYLAACSPEAALEDIPSGWVIVHIDLDYFINDFNGASRGADYTPAPALRREAEEKLQRFFGALAKAGVRVDRWILATSPGFCSACHWEWLLAAIQLNIAEIEARPA